MTGLAGRITVNSALLANPSDLTVYSTSPPTAAGDTTRSDFIYSQLTSGTFTYSPKTGLGSTTSPFTGTITSYLQQFISQQANAATSATQLQQGQDVVVSTLQQKFNSTSGVNIDTEMSNLIALQNSYAANAHVMSVVQSMMTDLDAGSSCKASPDAINRSGFGGIAVRPGGAEPQQPAHEPVDAARDRREVDHLFRHGHR